jgi:prepilin-type N-terminal cleavage/methylation domain-containing protein
MKQNQKGFSVVEILIVIAVIGLIGAVGWLVYYRQKTKTSDSQPATQTSTEQKDAVEAQPTQKTDPNEGYLVVKEWGLRFKTPTGLTDVKYTIHDDTVAFFAKPTGSSVQYRADYDKYEEGRSQYATGNLYRSKESTKDKIGIVVEGKKIGDYYYYTSWAFSSLATGAACVGTYGDADSNCQPEATAFQLVNQGGSALLNTIEIAE